MFGQIKFEIGAGVRPSSPRVSHIQGQVEGSTCATTTRAPMPINVQVKCLFERGRRPDTINTACYDACGDAMEHASKRSRKAKHSAIHSALPAHYFGCALGAFHTTVECDLL